MPGMRKNKRQGPGGYLGGMPQGNLQRLPAGPQAAPAGMPDGRQAAGIPGADTRGLGGGNKRRLQAGGPQLGGEAPSQWGAGNAYNTGSTMDQIQRNEYLNTLAVGGPREQAMNQMGYWNQGTPYTPQAMNPGQKWMNQSMENVAPGSQYQIMGQGGYNGVVTGGTGTQSSYSSLAPGTFGHTGGHMEFGQQGQDTGHGRPNPRPNQSQGGMPNQGPGGGGGQGPHGRPGGGGRTRPRPRPGGGQGALAGGGMPGGVGEFPQQGKPVPNFLPMTPGYEQDWRGLNDQLSQAEGQFAQGQAMLPAQYNLEKTRLQNDQTTATNRLNEDLAGRGVYTARNAAGGYGGTSPSGGGIGESLYGRNVATPFGRQFQDLAASGAGAYQNLYGDYAGANLGYAQGNNQALLNRANEAYQLDPMGLATSGYNLPDMAQPYYPFAPQGRPGGGGRRRPNKNKNKNKNKGKNNGK